MDNSWITYVGRSFTLIKTSLLNALSTKLPELTDRSPGNLFVVIIDMMASALEVFHYYVDNISRELFITSARRYASLLKLARLINYNGKAKLPSSTSLVITVNDSNGDPVPSPDYINIPIGTRFTDENGNNWALIQPTSILKGLSSTVVGVSQYLSVSEFNLGVSNGEISQKFKLPLDYAQASIVLKVEGVLWTYVPVFGYSLPGDLHYSVQLQVDGNIYVVFGDGVNGFVPENNSNITIGYNSTLGPSGNVSTDQIKTFYSDITLPTGVESITCTNPIVGYGGRDIENLEMLRKSIPASLRTLGRAVTRADYEDMALLVPGVRASKLDHTQCKWPISIYIVPHFGGLPSTTLLENVKLFLESNGIMLVEVEPLPAGESFIVCDMTIHGEYGMTESTILAQAQEALFESYNPQKTEINQPILISDLIAGVHNQSAVKHVNLNHFYISPYLRTDKLDVILVYDIRLRPGANQKSLWQLWYKHDTTSFRLIKDGIFLQEFTELGVWHEDVGDLGLLDIRIVSIDGANTYPNVVWQFSSYPYGKDCYLDDFSIPVMDLISSSLEIITDGQAT